MTRHSVVRNGNQREAARRYSISFGIRLAPLTRLLCTIAVACACTCASRANATVTVTDDNGASVTLAAPAQRVISLAPHVTELIYAAGGGRRVVGAVSYSDYPPAATQIARVGDNNALDLERIAALKPDLIVVWRHGSAQAQLERLRQLHIPMFYSDPHRLDDVALTLTRLGTLLGTSNIADAAASRYRHDIADLRTRYANRPLVSVFYQVWDRPLMTLNGTHMVSDVITLCGGRNVFAKLQPLVPTVSTEAVLAANPEAIFTSEAGATKPDTPLPQLDRWRAWPGLEAVARNNLFAIDGDLIDRPTPRLAQGAAKLCEDLEIARSRRPGGKQ